MKNKVNGNGFRRGNVLKNGYFLYKKKSVVRDRYVTIEPESIKQAEDLGAIGILFKILSINKEISVLIDYFKEHSKLIEAGLPGDKRLQHFFDFKEYELRPRQTTLF